MRPRFKVSNVGEARDRTRDLWLTMKMPMSWQSTLNTDADKIS